MAKYKYLEFREKPFNKGDLFLRIDVTALNKKEINKKWDELIKRFPIDKFQSCLSEVKEKFFEFDIEKKL